tara:strand:- start:1497 stop:1808 length:312 start_codon:yes stop_codon:yes gene_type:complete
MIVGILESETILLRVQFHEVGDRQEILIFFDEILNVHFVVDRAPYFIELLFLSLVNITDISLDLLLLFLKLFQSIRHFLRSTFDLSVASNTYLFISCTKLPIV